MPVKANFCKLGHARTPENLAGRTCKICMALRARKKRTHCTNGHERIPDNLYYNGTCKQCAASRAKHWNESNPSKRKEVARRSLWKTRYKLTEERYYELLSAQGGVCPICKQPPLEEKFFVIDHDHNCCSGTEICGKCIRGLIHQKCNHALGIFRDNPTICRIAAEYLENPPAKGLWQTNVQ
jgi:hypothetical protein